MIIEKRTLAEGKYILLNREFKFSYFSKFSQPFISLINSTNYLCISLKVWTSIGLYLSVLLLTQAAWWKGFVVFHLGDFVADNSKESRNGHFLLPPQAAWCTGSLCFPVLSIKVWGAELCRLLYTGHRLYTQHTVIFSCWCAIICTKQKHTHTFQNKLPTIRQPSHMLLQNHCWHYENNTTVFYYSSGPSDDIGDRKQKWQ